MDKHVPTYLLQDCDYIRTLWFEILWIRKDMCKCHQPFSHCVLWFESCMFHGRNFQNSASKCAYRQCTRSAVLSLSQPCSACLLSWYTYKSILHVYIMQHQNLQVILWVLFVFIFIVYLFMCTYTMRHVNILCKVAACVLLWNGCDDNQPFDVRFKALIL